MHTISKKIKVFAVGSVMLTGLVNAPLVPVQLHVVAEAQIQVLDTPSGHLEKGYYHKETNGDISYAEPSATSSSVFYKVVKSIPVGATEAHDTKVEYNKVCEDVDASLYSETNSSPTCNTNITPLESMTGLAQASIAFGNTTTEGTNTGTNSLTITGPVVSGTNTVGLVDAFAQTNLSGFGVTWGGVAMTFVDGKTEPTFGVERLETWIVLNPASSASIIFTRTGTTNAMGVRASYYTGVNQSTTVDNHTTAAQASGINFPVTLNVNDPNAWTVLQSRSDAANQSAVTNATLRSTYSQQGHFDSNAVTGAGNFTMTVTDGSGAGDQWGVMISLAPPSVSTVSPSNPWAPMIGR